MRVTELKIEQDEWADIVITLTDDLSSIVIHHPGSEHTLIHIKTIECLINVLHKSKNGSLI